MRLITIALAFLLAACSHSSNVAPPPSPTSGWVMQYSADVNGSCENFDFPPAGSTGVHYCVRQMGLSVGQTLTMTFSLSGNVSLVPVQTDDFGPATVHLFMQRNADDLSCIGTKQQFRYWTPAHVNLESAGTFTLSVPITPDQWTDCYGEPGTNHESEFKNTVNNLSAVGFTFGGQNFFGHGVAGSGHFALNQFSTGLSYKRKHKRRR